MSRPDPARIERQRAEDQIEAAMADARRDEIVDDLHTDEERALVPVPSSKEQPPHLPDPRRSDVDEWGRSEQIRALARRLYDPIYRSGSGSSGRASRRSPPTAAPCSSPTTPAPSRPTRR